MPSKYAKQSSLDTVLAVLPGITCWRKVLWNCYCDKWIGWVILNIHCHSPSQFHRSIFHQVLFGRSVRIRARMTRKTLCWLYIAAPPPDRECEDGYGQCGGGGGCGQAVVSRPSHCEINGSSLLSLLFSIACKHSAACHHFGRKGVAFRVSATLAA